MAILWDAMKEVVADKLFSISPQVFLGLGFNRRSSEVRCGKYETGIKGAETKIEKTEKVNEGENVRFNEPMDVFFTYGDKGIRIILNGIRTIRVNSLEASESEYLMNLLMDPQVEVTSLSESPDFIGNDKL